MGRWLTCPKDDVLLQKRGVRTRKQDKLADEPMGTIRGFDPECDAVPTRTIRTGKPA